MSTPTPPKRWPFGDPDEPPFTLHEGYVVCADCGGDGGGDYPARWNYSADEPEYDWAECSTCEGTGQVLTMEGALEKDRKKIEALGGDAGPREAFIFDLDEEIPF